MLTPNLDRALIECECQRAKEELAALRQSHYSLVTYLAAVKQQTDHTVECLLSDPIGQGASDLPRRLP